MRNEQKKLALFVVFALLLIVLIAIIFARLDAAPVARMETTSWATVETDAPEVAPMQMLVKLVSVYFPIPEVMPSTEISDAGQATESPVVERYSAIAMTEDELRDVAAITFLEAGNQSAEGQQAVVEVIFNRCIADNFPDTVTEVLYEGADTNCPQFSTIGLIDTIEPTQAQYDAINAALYGTSILPADVVFFSRGGENDRIWGRIGDHVFCRQYEW